MKINNFRGDLSDISAKKTSLVWSGVQVAALARYAVDVPTAQSLFIPRNLSEAMAQPDAA